MRRQIDRFDAERARREGAERRDRTLREQIAKEVQAQQDLQHERDVAIESLAALKTQTAKAAPTSGGRVEELTRQVDELRNERDRLARETVNARNQISALQQTIRSREAVRAATAEAAPSSDGAPALARSDSRPILLAVALVCAVPFLLIGCGVLFSDMGIRLLSSYDRGNSGVIAAALITWTGAILLLRRRGSEVTGVEVALFWLACAAATAPALAAFTAVNSRIQPGLLLGCLLAVVSGLIQIVRRMSRSSGVEFAIYYLGCLLAGGIAIVVSFHENGWSWFGPYRYDQTGMFVAATLALAAVLFMAYRRGALLDGVERALYWVGSSIAGAWGLGSLFYGLGSGSDIPAFAGMATAAVLSLAAEFVLIRREQLGGVERLIYFLGGSLAGLFLLGLLLTALGASVSAVLLFCAAAFVAAIVATYALRPRQAVSSATAG